MPSKTKLKNAASAARSAALPKNSNELIDQFVTGPMTGKGVVNRIVIDLAVMDVTTEGLKLVELAPKVTRKFVQSKTGVPPI